MVEGYIFACDQDFNLLILDSHCKLLQTLPYGKIIVDVVADDKHFFIGDNGFKVIIMEKDSLVIVNKIDCRSYVAALTKVGENLIRVVGDQDMSFYINTKTLEVEKTDKIYCWDLRQFLYSSKGGIESSMYIG